MKKILNFSYACILLSIVLSSCSSSVSITKRRYTKGYYVGHTTKPSTVIAFYKPESRLTNLYLKIASNSEPDLSNQLVIDKTIIDPILPSNRINIGVNKAPLKSAINLMEVNAGYEDEEAIVNNSASPGSERGGHAASDVPFVVIVLCAIFIPPLGVGLMYGITGYFWIDLILTLLFFFPGMIFALIVVLM